MNSEVSFQTAFEQHEAGNLDEAERIYREILQQEPGNADVLHLLGVLLFQKKDYDAAIDLIKQSIEHDPSNEEAYYNLAGILQDVGKLDEAITYYQKVIDINPDLADTYNSLGAVLQRKGQLDDAIADFRKAIELNPGLAMTHFNLGYALQQKGQLDDAIASYRKAIEIKPDFDDAYYNLGVVFQAQGRLDEATANYCKAIHHNPENADVHNNLGLLFKEKGQHDAAAASFRNALAINPNLPDVWYNLGHALQDIFDLEGAIIAYQKAISLNPNSTGAYNNLGNIWKDVGKLQEAEEHYRYVLRIDPGNMLAYSNILSNMNYDSRYDAGTVFKEHLEFAKKFAEPLSSTMLRHTNDRDPHRRLRIGYVSPDFRRHSVAYFVEPVLSSHNRERHEIFCYSDVLHHDHDDVTKRIQKYADQWIDITEMSDEMVSEQIRSDKIDILIDLAGHTGGNRVLLFARKPAPIQVSWIGYLATTGLSTMDYKIVDSYSDPPGKTEQFYTERLLRLPESFLCYLPDKDSPDVGLLPALSTGHITFGSFNNLAKVTSEVFTLWARILYELRNSHLIMKDKSFHDKTTCQYVVNMFTRRGIAPERITLQSANPSPKHLQAYNLVDIGLDTFPFNGATTTCEAMWMGVPVITLEGTAYHARVGVSLLSSVGLPELVAKTPEEYTSIAVNLAKDLKRLRSLRQHLRDMMRYSPLCDAKRFTTNLERCYRQIWATWCTSV